MVPGVSFAQFVVSGQSINAQGVACDTAHSSVEILIKKLDVSSLLTEIEQNLSDDTLLTIFL